VLILRFDKQDYQGTAVTVELARRLGVPHLMLVVNMIPPGYDPAAVRTKVAETYGCDVAAVLPYSDRLSARGAAGPFVLENLEHPATTALRHVAEELAR
jgi:MinD-like ATPase involved in chromosome partitioning or flagellar assembly